MRLLICCVICDLLKNAHSAEADIALCFHVFCCALLSIPTETPLTSWGAIWKLSEACRVPKVMGFGEHKGKAIADVPAGYVNWYRRQKKTDPYLIAAFQKAGLLP